MFLSMRTTNHYLHADASERVIRQFEENWQGSQLAHLEELAAAAADSSYRVLVELAHIDIEFRVKSGEPARAAEYFERYPHLAADVKSAVSLILAEFEFRQRHDSTVSFEAIVRQYPQFEEPLWLERDRIKITQSTLHPRQTV